MHDGPDKVIRPVRPIQPKRNTQYRIKPAGWIFFFLAVLILFFGFFGYLEYDRIVKPYFKEYICCLPAIILAGLLFFFGFASRVTTIRQVNLTRTNLSTKQRSDTFQDTKNNSETGATSANIIPPTQHGDNISGELDKMTENSIKSNSTIGLKKFEPDNLTRAELVSQKRNLVQFLKNLDEQYKDGLLMENVYMGLKNKYNHELLGLDNRLKNTQAGNNIKSKNSKTRKVRK